MSSLTKRIEERWKAQRKSINVPEFANGETDFPVYFLPYSGYDQQLIGPELQRDTIEALWKIILHKALDSEGNPLFAEDDKDVVLGCIEAQVLDRIATAMIDVTTPEQAKKN